MRKIMVLLAGCVVMSASYADYFCNDVEIKTNNGAGPSAFGRTAHCCMHQKDDSKNDPGWKQPLWVFDSCKNTTESTVEVKTGCDTKNYCNFSVWYEGCLDPNWCKYLKRDDDTATN